MPKELNNLDHYLNLDASGLADTLFHCTVCGKAHQVPINKILTGDGLIEMLPALAAQIVGGRPRKVALIYDLAIEEIIQDCVIDKLPALSLLRVGLGQRDSLLEPDVELGDAVAARLEADVDFVIGAGSGVISDLTKWIATKAHKPFILYGTAASMNAHTSVTSTMTMRGIKTSVWLDPAQAVLFDIPVIAQSPKLMRLAGMGDLIARSICNADWMLGSLIRKKYFCPVPYWITGNNEERYLAAARGIGLGEARSVQLLGESILVSGISMTMLGGETSPSSGSEHVFSHYWDLQVELEGASKNLHGIQVGVGTILSYALFDTMRQLDLHTLDPQRLLKQRPKIEALKEENRVKFGPKAYLFDEVLDQKWVPDDQFVPYLRQILDNWEATWEGLHPYIGCPDKIVKSMESAGFVFSLDTIQRERAQALDALIYGNRYRSRYTMLDLAWELGVLPGAAGDILARAGLG